MKKADLHIHSTVSDGSFTIPEILERGRQKGLDILAITDHDTLSHWDQIPEDPDLTVIPGIEISAFDYGENLRVHILGYGIRDRKTVEAFVRPLLEARHENSVRQIEILKKHGWNIEEEKLQRVDGRFIYKQHIMEYLVRTGQVSGMFGDFYRNVFKNGGICDFDIRYLDSCEAVRVVKEAGGLAVLAHSGQQQNFALIPKLVRSGLAGLELNHPANSEKDKKIISEYAERYGLFLTGGSDFHGKYEKNSADIGEFLSEEGSMWNRFSVT